MKATRFAAILAATALITTVPLMAMSMVPAAFSGLARTDGDNDPARLVAVYQATRTALVSNRPENHLIKFAEMEVPADVTAAIQRAAGTPPTRQSIKAAVAAYVEQNPQNAIFAAAAGMRLLATVNAPPEGQINLLAGIVDRLAELGPQNLESIAILTGFAAQIAAQAEKNVTAVISRFRQIAITNLPPTDDIIPRTIAVDNALVAANILVPIAADAQFWATILEQQEDFTMEMELLTDFTQDEIYTYLLSISGFDGGIIVTPFATAGSFDTAGNPGGLGTQIEEDILPFPTPTPTPTPEPTPTPTPIPTPTPPVS